MEMERGRGGGGICVCVASISKINVLYLDQMIVCLCRYLKVIYFMYSIVNHTTLSYIIASIVVFKEELGDSYTFRSSMWPLTHLMLVSDILVSLGIS